MITENSESSSGNSPLHPEVSKTLAADRSLESLAADINKAHSEAQAYASKAVERALLAGDLLIQAKARVQHGEFGDWCKVNLPNISPRQLQRYMRVARDLPVEKRLESFLPDSLAEALRLVAGDSEPEPSGDLWTTPTVYHDAITTQLLPVPPAITPAAITAALVALPVEDQHAVVAPVLAASGMKAVRSDAHYLHVSQGRHEWYTPAPYIEAARSVMGAIDLDPASCAIAQETVKAARYYSKDEDGLAQSWDGRVWLNPPFESELISPFIDKLVGAYLAGSVKQAIILTDVATDTGWFHHLTTVARRFCFTKGRIKFRSPLTDSQSPQRGQVFTYLGDRVHRFTEAFSEFGYVVQAAPKTSTEVAQ